MMRSKKKSTKGILLSVGVWMMMSYGAFGMTDNTLTNDMIYKTLSEKHANINTLLQEVFKTNSEDWEFSYYGCCNMCGCRNPMQFTYKYNKQQIFNNNAPFTSTDPYSFFDGVRDTYKFDNKNGEFSIYNQESTVLKINGMKDILTDDLFSHNHKKNINNSI